MLKLLSNLFVVFLIFSMIPISAFATFPEIFHPPHNLTNTPLISEYNPNMVVDGSNVYLTYVEFVNSVPDVFFSKSTDGGNTFTTINVTNTPTSSESFPYLAVSGDTVYIVSSNVANSPRDIFLSKSTDGGNTFTTTNITNTVSNIETNSFIITDGTYLYLTWADSYSNVIFAKSADGGNTFTTQTLGNTFMSNSFLSAPIAIDCTNIYVVWEAFSTQNFQNEIYLAKSTDGGNTFTTTNITNTLSLNEYQPFVTTDGLNIYVTFYIQHGAQSDVYLAKSTDGGNTFTTTNITNTPTSNESFANMITFGSTLYVMYTTGGANGIYVSKSIDGGTTFTTQHISPSGSAAFNSLLSTDDQNICASWVEDSPMHQDVFFTCASIISPANPLPLGMYDDYNPNMSVSAELPGTLNTFEGSEVVEVIVCDADIFETTEKESEPDVSVQGKDLRMTQATNGHWYGYFADRNAVQSDDALSNNLDFGEFCDGSSDLSASNTPLTFDETVGIAVSGPMTGSLNGLGGINGHDCTGSVSSVTSNVLPDASLLNTHQNVFPGQIDIDPSTWPVIQLYDFVLGSNILVQYNKGGGTQLTTLMYGPSTSTPNFATVQSSVAPHGDVTFTNLYNGPTSLTPVPPSNFSNIPTGVSFPYGLFDFVWPVPNPGDTLALNIEFPGPAPTSYWKLTNNGWVDLFGLFNADGSPMAMISPTNPNVIYLHIADNGPYDLDSTPGIVADPGGPGLFNAVDSIPEWIKNNAGWWADGQIDDGSFVQGIQFLIKENVLLIPAASSGEGTGSNEIPAWIKNNAGWWAEGAIDDDAFVQGIQFLIKEGIIVI